MKTSGRGPSRSARALAGAIGGFGEPASSSHPDLLPTDITGVSVYDQVRRELEFKPGPVSRTS
ncbi:AAA family ATPase [Kocuria rhizophila]|nr:AAA family ATPase [Kocuria rhizophila]